MGHGARSLQAKWKHNIDPGEMEEEGVGALLAVRLHSARSLGPTQRRARLHEPRGSAVRTPPPPGGEYLTSSTRALAVARGGGRTTMCAAGRRRVRRRARAARGRTLIPRRPLPRRARLHNPHPQPTRQRRRPRTPSRPPVCLAGTWGARVQPVLFAPDAALACEDVRQREDVRLLCESVFERARPRDGGSRRRRRRPGRGGRAWRGGERVVSSVRGCVAVFSWCKLSRGVE